MNAPGEIRDAEGKPLAIIAEGLYLLNLLFPLLPLLALVWLRWRHRAHPDAVVRSHLKQTFAGAALSTGLFACANLLILLLGGYATVHALVVFEVYFIFCVPPLLIPGLLGLIKAMAGQDYRYPLLGRFHAP